MFKYFRNAMLGDKKMANQKNTFAPTATNAFHGEIPWFDIYIHILTVHLEKQHSQMLALFRKPAIIPIRPRNPFYHTFLRIILTIHQQKNSKRIITMSGTNCQRSTRSRNYILTQKIKYQPLHSSLK